MAYVTLDVSQGGPESFVNKVGFLNHTYLLCFTVSFLAYRAESSSELF